MIFKTTKQHPNNHPVSGKAGLESEIPPLLNYFCGFPPLQEVLSATNLFSLFLFALHTAELQTGSPNERTPFFNPQMPGLQAR